MIFPGNDHATLSAPNRPHSPALAAHAAATIETSSLA